MTQVPQIGDAQSIRTNARLLHLESLDAGEKLVSQTMLPSTLPTGTFAEADINLNTGKRRLSRTHLQEILGWKIHVKTTSPNKLQGAKQ